MNKYETVSKQSIKIQHNLLIILFLYSFLFTDIVKEVLLHNIGLSFKLSILPVIIIIYLLINYRRNNWTIALVIFILIYSLLGCIQYNYGINTVLRFMNTITIPILLTSIKIYNPKLIFKKILKIMNIFVTIYVLLGVIDYLTNGIIREIMVNVLKTSYYTKSMVFDSVTGSYRWFSLFGHPLVNTSYIIIFITSNIIYINKYNEKVFLNIYLVYCISIIGIVLSNSKMGLIIMVLLLIFNIINEKRKFMYISVITLAAFLVMNSNFFEENVLSRFQYAIESGDITNGRFTVLNELLYRNIYDIDIFIGKGMTASDQLVKDSFGSNSGLTNMEIPLLMFLYEYGLFATLCIYLIIYIYPSYMLLIRRKISNFILMSLLFLFLNSYNGIATGTGVMLLYSYIIMIYLNVSIYRETENYIIKES